MNHVCLRNNFLNIAYNVVSVFYYYILRMYTFSFQDQGVMLTHWLLDEISQEDI